MFPHAPSHPSGQPPLSAAVTPAHRRLLLRSVLPSPLHGSFRSSTCRRHACSLGEQGSPPSGSPWSQLRCPDLCYRPVSPRLPSRPPPTDALRPALVPPSKDQEALGSLPTPTSRYGRCDLSEGPAVHKNPRVLGAAALAGVGHLPSVVQTPPSHSEPPRLRSQSTPFLKRGSHPAREPSPYKEAPSRPRLGLRDFALGMDHFV